MKDEKTNFEKPSTERLYPEGEDKSPGEEPTAVTQPGDYYFKAFFKSRGLVGMFHRMRITKLMHYVSADNSVLDLGCGSGVLLYLLKNKGCSVAGVDIRPECVEFAGKACEEGDFRCRDITNLDMGRAFDVVFCTEVIEHFDRESRLRILDVVKRHTLPGGFAVITFPSGVYTALEPIWRVVRKIMSPGMTFDDDDRHERLGKSEIEDDLRERGFRLIQSGTQCLGTVRCVWAQRLVEE